MNVTIFKWLLVTIASCFALAFIVVVGPPLLASRDIVAGFAAGFVNPYSTGYALDTLMCWCVLAIWVVYEARTYGVKRGWIALALGVVPGVATGFAVYLLLRLRQMERFGAAG